jgi:hypothetical protein
MLATTARGAAQADAQTNIAAREISPEAEQASVLRHP